MTPRAVAHQVPLSMGFFRHEMYALQCRRCKSHRFDPLVGKIPWSRKWQLASVILPGKLHGQRSLVGYSPWGGKESDMTDHEHTHSSNQPYPNTTAKSLQSFPTLCDPIDGSPPGSAVPGILQEKTLEWVAIGFSIPIQSRS